MIDIAKDIKKSSIVPTAITIKIIPIYNNYRTNILSFCIKTYIGNYQSVIMSKCYSVWQSINTRRNITYSMVKHLNIILDDSDYKKLVKAKGEMNWRDFVMQLAESGK